MKGMVCFLGLLLIVAACKKQDNDETDPVISEFLVEGDTFLTVTLPATVNFSYAVTDNTALGQYRFNVTDDFSPLNLSTVGSNYSYSWVDHISGTSSSSTIQITIPDTANAGPYRATFDVIDSEGNSAEQMEVELMLTNSYMATVSLSTYTNPVNPGDTLFLTGTITDLNGLGIERINMALYDNLGATQYYQTYSYTDTTVTTWNFSEIESDSLWIVVDGAAAAGTYTLHIEGKDTEENFDVLEHEITVN